MIDIEKQVNFWVRNALEDWDVAKDLVSRSKTRYGLFFAHLAIEKLLKAHVCRDTKDLAPRINNLVRLAELTSIKFSETQIDILADINIYNIEGRYPDELTPPPSPKSAMENLEKAEEIIIWLKNQL